MTPPWLMERVRDQSLEVVRRDDADGQHEHRREADDEKLGRHELVLPRAINLQHAYEAHERAVELHGGEQRRHRGGRFVVSLRQPRVHRRQPELRAETDEDERETDAAPERRRPSGERRQLVEEERRRVPLGRQASRNAGVPQEGESEAHGREEEVPPGRATGRRDAVAHNERRHRERRGFERDPPAEQVVREHDEVRADHEDEAEAGEPRRGVAKRRYLSRARPHVPGDPEEDHVGHDQEQACRRVNRQIPTGDARRPGDRERDDDRRHRLQRGGAEEHRGGRRSPGLRGELSRRGNLHERGLRGVHRTAASDAAGASASVR